MVRDDEWVDYPTKPGVWDNNKGYAHRFDGETCSDLVDEWGKGQGFWDSLFPGMKWRLIREFEKKNGQGMYRDFSEYGKAIAFNWGRDDGGDKTEAIQKMSVENKQLCLLAAVVTELTEIRVELNRLREPTVSIDTHPVSDGMLEALRRTIDHVITNDDLSVLPHRVQNKVRRAGVKYVSEITRELMMSVRDCGVKSTNEILAWAESLKTNHSADTNKKVNNGS